MDADLAERTFVITGANTGIGRAAAETLAKRGGRVLFACRSEAKTAPVVEAIRQASGHDKAEFVPLDLASLASVRACARLLNERSEPIDVLINNAGVAGASGVTQDGFELTFGVNHIGHFLLTQLLLDKLKASAPARIVNVASRGHFRAQGIDFDAVRRRTKSGTGFPEYTVSKLANVLFTKELARRLKGSGVTAYALHPGVVATDVWRRVPWFLRGLIKLLMISSERGARTTVYCATAGEVANESGLYYDDCVVKTPNPVAEDEALAAELWKRSEAWIHDKGK